jgi:hypothetical protein
LRDKSRRIFRPSRSDANTKRRGGPLYDFKTNGPSFEVSRSEGRKAGAGCLLACPTNRVFSPKIVIQHRKATDLVSLHDPPSFFDLLILVAAGNVCSHHLLDGGSHWIFAFSYRSERKISVS